MEFKDESANSFKISSKFETITTNVKINDACKDSKTQQLGDVLFLLSIFDNIVGPKIIHIWKYNVSLQENSYLSDYLLKYIAVHTLNGELYQDKLMGQIKYRIYLIKEINCAIFSVFFDADTVSMNDFGSSTYPFKKNDSKDKIKKNSSNSENFQVLNNCLSLIFPLDKKDSFFNKTLLSSNVFLNFFENVILEFKVYAHIRPKVSYFRTIKILKVL